MEEQKNVAFIGSTGFAHCEEEMKTIALMCGASKVERKSDWDGYNCREHISYIVTKIIDGKERVFVI